MNKHSQTLRQALRQLRDVCDFDFYQSLTSVHDGHHMTILVTLCLIGCYCTEIHTRVHLCIVLDSVHISALCSVLRIWAWLADNEFIAVSNFTRKFLPRRRQKTLCCEKSLYNGPCRKRHRHS